MISISTDKNKVIIEGCLELLKKHREGHIVINPAYMLAMTPMMGREPSVAILKDTVCRGLFTQDGVQYSVKVTERELPDGTAYILQCYPDSIERPKGSILLISTRAMDWNTDLYLLYCSTYKMLRLHDEGHLSLSKETVAKMKTLIKLYGGEDLNETLIDTLSQELRTELDIAVIDGKPYKYETNERYETWYAPVGHEGAEEAPREFKVGDTVRWVIDYTQEELVYQTGTVTQVKEGRVLVTFSTRSGATYTRTFDSITINEL